MWALATDQADRCARVGLHPPLTATSKHSAYCSVADYHIIVIGSHRGPNGFQKLRDNDDDDGDDNEVY